MNGCGILMCLMSFVIIEVSARVIHNDCHKNSRMKFHVHFTTPEMMKMPPPQSMMGIHPPPKMMEMPPPPSMKKMPPPPSMKEMSSPPSMMKMPSPQSMMKMPPSQSMMGMHPPPSMKEMPPPPSMKEMSSPPSMMKMPSPQSMMKMPSPQSMMKMPPSQSMMKMPSPQSMMKMPSPQSMMEMHSPPKMMEMPSPPSMKKMPPPQSMMKMPPSQSMMKMPSPQSRMPSPPSMMKIENPPMAHKDVKKPLEENSGSMQMSPPKMKGMEKNKKHLVPLMMHVISPALMKMEKMQMKSMMEIRHRPIVNKSKFMPIPTKKTIIIELEPIKSPIIESHPPSIENDLKLMIRPRIQSLKIIPYDSFKSFIGKEIKRLVEIYHDGNKKNYWTNDYQDWSTYSNDNKQEEFDYSPWFVRDLTRGPQQIRT